MLKNQKYSTYLPGFFLCVSVFVKLGYETFNEWLTFWRPVSFSIHFAIGVLLYFVLLRRSGIWLALFGSLFWLLSRWSVSVMNSGQIDPLAILILLLSLLSLEKNPRLGLILFGLSLSVKQIGIFMLPVYLMTACCTDKTFTENLKIGVKNFAYIAVFPLLFTLPFLIWDAKGLVMSILFSATRSPGGHIKVPSVDEILGYVGIFAKVPMIFLMGSLYMLVLERKIGVFVAALAIYLTFISFNSVLFKQYMPWFCAFIGLALSEFQKLSSKEKSLCA